MFEIFTVVSKILFLGHKNSHNEKRKEKLQNKMFAIFVLVPQINQKIYIKSKLQNNMFAIFTLVPQIDLKTRRKRRHVLKCFLGPPDCP
jgi:hypothetical protein